MRGVWVCVLTGQDDGGGLLVVVQRPQEQLGEVDGVDELSVSA